MFLYIIITVCSYKSCKSLRESPHADQNLFNKLFHCSNMTNNQNNDSEVI